MFEPIIDDDKYAFAFIGPHWSNFISLKQCDPEVIHHLEKAPNKQGQFDLTFTLEKELSDNAPSDAYRLTIEDRTNHGASANFLPFTSKDKNEVKQFILAIVQGLTQQQLIGVSVIDIQWALETGGRELSLMTVEAESKLKSTIYNALFVYTNNQGNLNHFEATVQRVQESLTPNATLVAMIAPVEGPADAFCLTKVDA
ncbi:hypothetical protein [Photobacterium alginatilyticum]|uniref:Uncharacterized protein n=1 Tax=Photobacterium alginatilyticum TaxID=1775171 RepID=A0ABW9YHK8_9GAMM|nr:hypothetical protein [Photobacterium alginatilyticum]NBI53243.1 hypothetical protein [Photobacterium alginatilyticum]